MKKVGIYMVTSPTGKIYIGQSVDIVRRFKAYLNPNQNKDQLKLHSSLMKHGAENHKFEILEQCSEVDLNNRERFYIDKFKTFDSKHGMNLMYGQSKGSRHSLSTRSKISKALSGRKSPLKGQPRPEYVRLKISIAHLGVKHGRRKFITQDEIRRIKEKLIGVKHTEERKANIRKSLLNSPNLRRHPVQQLSLHGELIKSWPSIELASQTLDIDNSGIRKACTGKIKKSGGFKWKYL